MKIPSGKDSPRPPTRFAWILWKLHRLSIGQIPRYRVSAKAFLWNKWLRPRLYWTLAKVILLALMLIVFLPISVTLCAILLLLLFLATFGTTE